MKKTGGVLVPPDYQNKALNVQICRKKVEVKTLTKTAELREDLSLMIRPDINIEDVIIVHEFSCIPRSFRVCWIDVTLYGQKQTISYSESFV